MAQRYFAKVFSSFKVPSKVLDFAKLALEEEKKEKSRSKGAPTYQPQSENSSRGPDGTPEINYASKIIGGILSKRAKDGHTITPNPEELTSDSKIRIISQL